MGIVVDIGTTESSAPWKELAFVIILVILAVIGFGAAYIMKVYSDNRLERYKADLSKFERELRDYKVIESSYRNKRKQIEFIKKKAKQLRELKFEPLKIAFLLRQLPKILPEDAWISNLRIDATRGTVNFSVQIVSTREELLTKTAELLDKVSKDPFFYNPEIGNINIREQKGFPIAQFSVRLNYRITLEQLEKIYKLKPSSETMKESENTKSSPEPQPVPTGGDK